MDPTARWNSGAASIRHSPKRPPRVVAAADIHPALLSKLLSNPETVVKPHAVEVRLLTSGVDPLETVST
jgi:hypothetical protein